MKALPFLTTTFLLVFAPFICKPQSCGVDTEDAMLFSQILKKYNKDVTHFRLDTSLVYIPIVYHEVRSSWYDSGWSMLPDNTAKVQGNIERMNKLLMQSRIQLYLYERNIIVSDEHYFFRREDEDALANGHDYVDVVNLYSVNSILYSMNWYAGGYAYYPGGKDRIFIAYHDFETFAHEFGHFFGLMHTFENNQHPELKELVARTHCWETGDLFCDTPADPYTEGKSRDYADCYYSGNEIDENLTLVQEKLKKKVIKELNLK